MGMPKSHPTHSFVLCHDHDIIQTSLWTSQHGLPSELQDQIQVLQIMLKKALVAVKVSLSHDRTEYVFGIHQSVLLVCEVCNHGVRHNDVGLGHGWFEGWPGAVATWLTCLRARPRN